MYSAVHKLQIQDVTPFDLFECIATCDIVITLEIIPIACNFGPNVKYSFTIISQNNKVSNLPWNRHKNE